MLSYGEDRRKARGQQHHRATSEALTWRLDSRKHGGKGKQTLSRLVSVFWSGSRIFCYSCPWQIQRWQYGGTQQGKALAFHWEGCICFQILFQHQRHIQYSNSLFSRSHRNGSSGPECVSTKWMVEMGLEPISLAELLRSHGPHLEQGRRALAQITLCFFLQRAYVKFSRQVHFYFTPNIISFFSVYILVWNLGYKKDPNQLSIESPSSSKWCQEVLREIPQLEPHLSA